MTRLSRFASLAALLLSVSSSGAASAAEKPAADKPLDEKVRFVPKGPAEHANDDLSITLRIMHLGSEIKATIITTSGTQANLKIHDANAHAFLSVNVLPAIDPDREGKIAMQYQVEVTGEGEGRKTDFQAQGEATLVDGKEKTLMEAAGAKLSVTVSLAQPD